MSKAGEFEIEVWRDGYPVVCNLKYEGKTIARFTSDELSDLEYAAKKAIAESAVTRTGRYPG